MRSENNKLTSYWSQPLDDLFAALQSSGEGLSTPEAMQRLKEFGPNILKKRKGLP